LANAHIRPMNCAFNWIVFAQSWQSVLAHLKPSASSSSASQQASTPQRPLDDCLSLLAAGFLRGGVGFLKGSTGMTTNLPRDVRVGVTMVRTFS
jgi:hypothetical protein